MSDFEWPEPTDAQLAALLDRCPPALEIMRDAIHLSRRLDAAHHEQIMQAWERGCVQVNMTLATWLLTRGGTVEPIPPPAPTLAEAREAARLLAGPAAEIVTRYLESQEGQADG